VFSSRADRVIVRVFGESATMRSASGLHRAKEPQYNEYDYDNEQRVNPTAGAR
jgi:hypothetical protein